MERENILTQLNIEGAPGPASRMKNPSGKNTEREGKINLNERNANGALCDLNGMSIGTMSTYFKIVPRMCCNGPPGHG